MWPWGPKSSDSHPKETAPPNRTWRLAARPSGTARPARSSRTRWGRRCMNTDVSSWPPWMPMPPSAAGEAPPWSGGTNGWTKKVIRPWRRRMSRQATLSRAELPPWPLRNTSRRARVAATERAMSSSTASRVSADSHSVPGDQACSLDFDTDRVGSSHRSQASPWSATSRAAASWAITWSTDRGRWGPCCSTAPMGWTITADSVTRSPTSGPLRSSRFLLTAGPYSGTGREGAWS